MDVLYGVYLLDSDYYEDAFHLFAQLVSQLSSLNRRTLDLLSAKVYYYYALCHERWGDADSTQSTDGSSSTSASSAAILPVLLASYRTCCLQHNEPGQAVLINCILRSYLSCRQYALADTFRLKSAYPSDLRVIPACCVRALLPTTWARSTPCSSPTRTRSVGCSRRRGRRRPGRSRR